VERGWPGHGPWVIAATSGDVDWRAVASVLAAVAEVPVAMVLVGGRLAADDPMRERVAGVVELAAVDRLSLAQARDLVVAASRAHGLTLVGADAGLLVPMGRDGWSLADLAVAAGAPVVVVTGAGPDAVNHTTLALGALAGHGIIGTVVTVGDVDEESLPVTPGGRIPAELPDDLAGAPEWLDPALRATATPAAATPAAARRDPVSGKQLVLALLAVFLVLVALVCGIAWAGRSPSEVEFYTNQRPAPMRSAVAVPMTAFPQPEDSPPPARPVTTACPLNSSGTAVTRPDAATTARVNAAWQRIEKWLGRHAPAGAHVLAPPATAARIDALQRQMSVAFPPDLVASLRRHDGLTAHGRFALPPFYSPESLAGILADWKVNCGVAASEDTSWTGNDPWWDRAYIPIAESGDGGCLLADQRPGRHGRVGEFYPEDGASFERWPGSVAELLEGTATSLETRRPYAGQYRPKVDADGVLDWDII
jgi:cell wall assembly regulator SMI1